MSVRCHWRWASLARGGGAKLIIVTLAGAFAFAGTPQLYKWIHRRSARPAHSCVIMLPHSVKRVVPVGSDARPPATNHPTIQVTKELPALTPVWVRKLFWESCHYAHGPPRFTPGASVQVSGLLA
ncbi:MAG TPA: hypothetical protein VGM65_16075 [Candidatus Udaeobacter sp.]|jgi:hypothetical protein